MRDNNDVYGNSNSTPDPQMLPVVASPEPVMTTVASGETIAERHLATEVQAVRKQLRWTQIGSVLLSVFVLGYLTYLTTSINRTLEPKAAAEVAQGLITQQVEDRARELSADLKLRVPKMIANFPDYAKQQLPQYRQKLEIQIDSDLTKYLAQHTTDLDKMVDEALEEHKDSIGAMLKDGKNPEVAKAVGEELQSKMLISLNNVSVNGESLQTKLDMTLANLSDMDKRMAKLAANKNLTPDEKKARRAIALLSATIDKKQQESGPIIPVTQITLK